MVFHFPCFYFPTFAAIYNICPFPFILFLCVFFLVEGGKKVWFYSYVYSNLGFAFSIAFYYFLMLVIFFLLYLLLIVILYSCFNLQVRRFLWTIMFREFLLFLLPKQFLVLLMGWYIRISKTKEKCQSKLKEFPPSLM